MPDCTHHFFLAKMLREAEFNSTRFVQALPLFGGEFQIQTGELVLEVRKGLRGRRVSRPQPPTGGRCPYTGGRCPYYEHRCEGSTSACGHRSSSRFSEPAGDGPTPNDFFQ